MQFTNPLWLWGLSGLLIPMAIHLLSRKEGKIIKIGSVRHLDDTVSKQFKSIRLNEYLLLALRCLLIMFMVFLLAGLQFKKGGRTEKWLLVESGAENDSGFPSLRDSLNKHGYEVRAFAEGFPKLNETSFKNEKVDYWNLLEELQTKPVHEVIIFSNNYLEGFKGRRPSLPNQVRWISSTPGENKFTLNAIRISKDSIEIREGNSNEDKTFFSTTRIRTTSAPAIVNSSDSISIEFADTLRIAIVSDSIFARDSEIIAAALEAIDSKSPHFFLIETSDIKNASSTPNADWLIWLSEEPLSIRANQSVVYYDQCDGKNLLDQVAPSTWLLNKRLTEETALEGNLTVGLALILNPSEKYRVKATYSDRRTLPDEEISATHPSANSLIQASALPNAGQKYLGLLLLFALIIERWLSYKRNQ